MSVTMSTGDIAPSRDAEGGEGIADGLKPAEMDHLQRMVWHVVEQQLQAHKRQVRACAIAEMRAERILAVHAEQGC
jgi:hypothetical protein